MTESSAQPTGKANAPHYVWGDACDGWRLVDRAELSVIHERMPPGASEERHRHTRARQFFFVLAGELTLEVEGADAVLGIGQGLEIAPEVAHTAMNRGGGDVEFLVVSHPSTRGDRQP